MLTAVQHYELKNCVNIVSVTLCVFYSNKKWGKKEATFPKLMNHRNPPDYHFCSQRPSDHGEAWQRLKWCSDRDAIS